MTDSNLFAAHNNIVNMFIKPGTNQINWEAKEEEAWFLQPGQEEVENVEE